MQDSASTTTSAKTLKINDHVECLAHNNYMSFYIFSVLGALQMSFSLDQSLHKVGSDVHLTCNVTGKNPLPETGLFNITVEDIDKVFLPEWVDAKRQTLYFHMAIKDKIRAEKVYNGKTVTCQVTSTYGLYVQKDIQLRIYGKCDFKYAIIHLNDSDL